MIAPDESGPVDMLDARLDMAVVRIDCVLANLLREADRCLLLRARGDIVAARQMRALAAIAR